MTIIRKDDFAAFSAAHAKAHEPKPPPESAIALEQQPAYRAGIDAARRSYFGQAGQNLEEIFDVERYLQSHVADLVSAALDKVLGSLVAQDLIAACVARALQESGDAQPVVVHVAACDHAVAHETLAVHVPRASVQIDPLLEAGEIVLETHRGRQHVGPRAQFHLLKADLEASVR